MQPNKNETYSRGRVLIAEPNIAWGNRPYTLQPGACQQEGDYIHLTPDYITTDPNKNSKFKPGNLLQF